MQQRMTFTIPECGDEGTAPLLKRATVTIANLSRSLLCEAGVQCIYLLPLELRDTYHGTTYSQRQTTLLLLR